MIIIIPDTNILFPKDPSGLFSAGFIKGIKKLAEESGADIEVHIPDLVLLERAHQRATIAKGQYEKVKSGSESLKANLGLEIPLGAVDPKLIEDEALKQLGQEADTLKYKVIATPTDRINWSEIVDDAAWRRLPFEEGDKEKGFKDRVIFETVSRFCDDHPSARIYFVCNDHLLATTAKTLSSISNLAIVPDLSPIFDLVKIAETEAKQYAAEIFAKIAKEFYDKETNTGLFVEAGIQSMITKDYRHTLESPALDELYSGNDQPNPISILLANKELSEKRFDEANYNRIGGRRFKIGRTHLDKVNNGNFIWRTTVEFAGCFIGRIETNRGTFAPKWIQSSTLTVIWKNRPSDHTPIEFSEAEYLNTEFEAKNEITHFLRDPLAPTRYGYSTFSEIDLFSETDEARRENCDLVIG